MDEGTDEEWQRQESRRAISPKAVAARWSRDGEHNCAVKGQRESTPGCHRSCREDSRRAISY